MKPFSNKRTKRDTAFAALLVWVFALASGLANACLLEAPGRHAQLHSDVAKTRSEAAVAPRSTVHEGAVESDDDDSHSSRESCLKACDDGSKAPVKLQTGLDLTDPGTAPLVAVVWNTATPFISAPSRMHDLPPPLVGPPFRVRYARLAL